MSSEGSENVIELTGVSKRFATPSGGIYTALRDLDLTVAAGEFCAVVGPDRLRQVDHADAGLRTGAAQQRDGHRRRPAGRRDHRPASASCSRPTRSSRGRACWTTCRSARASAAAPERQANAAARDWLRRVGLAGFEDRYPHQLSGGMRKRVALAQSLINEPRVLLMDEPFSALDVQTRSIMSDELLGLWEQTRPAVIFVTHDLEEAIALADKVVVLTAGPARVKAVFDIDLPAAAQARRRSGSTASSSRCTPRSGRPCGPRSRRAYARTTTEVSA